MKSMTGYGKAHILNDKYDLHCEIKSVNLKNFDLKIYSYKELNCLEVDIQNFINEKIKRGKVELRINFRDRQVPKIEVDENKVMAYYKMLTDLKQKLQIKEEIRIETIINEPNVVSTAYEDYDNPAFRKVFFKCLGEALKNHQAMAFKEGKALKSFFKTSFDTIEKCLKEIKDSIPRHREKLKDSLTQTVRQILDNEISPDMEKRILLETALYLDRCDITEELVRMESHLKNIKSLIAKPPDPQSHTTDHRPPTTEIGKSMNFILQEMQREANTISAKYTTTSTFMSVLRMKEEVERCREQVQNIE